MQCFRKNNAVFTSSYRKKKSTQKTGSLELLKFNAISLLKLIFGAIVA